MTSCLPDWAASLAPWPVVTWPQFVEFLHQAVNPLAGEEHLKEVTQQLHRGMPNSPVLVEESKLKF